MIRVNTTWKVPMDEVDMLIYEEVAGYIGTASPAGVKIDREGLPRLIEILEQHPQIESFEVEDSASE